VTKASERAYEVLREDIVEWRLAPGTVLQDVEQLAGAGIDIVIHPASLLRIAMGAAERGLDTLVSDGSLKAEVPGMQTRARLYELLDYESYNAFNSSVFNFAVPAGR
jgi:methylisocitrate lyase